MNAPRKLSAGPRFVLGSFISNRRWNTFLASWVATTIVGISSVRGGVDVFDFSSDPAADARLRVYGTMQSNVWVQTGGNGGGFLALTWPLRTFYRAVVFPAAAEGRSVGSFVFECDVRVGNGSSERPADGFSVNFARSSDPTLVPGALDTQAAFVGGFPEAGTETGISICFDTWSGNALPDGPDIEGILVRVDNKTVLRQSLPTRHGSCSDTSSLQTGGRDAFYWLEGGLPLDPAGWATLCWQPLKVVMDADRRLTVEWKGRKLLDRQSTGYVPSPGRLILAGRTGDANEHTHFDNIRLTTTEEGGVTNALRFSLGLNFGAELDGGTLEPAQVAGVPDIAQANWNNLMEQSGKVSGLVADVAGTRTATSASVEWSSAGTWASTGLGEENNGFSGADRTLTTGYLDTSDESTTTIKVFGLPSVLTARSYDVYVYTVGGVTNRGGGYRIRTVDGSRILRDDVRARTDALPSVYHPAPVDPGLGQIGTGSFIVFSGLTASNILIEATTGRGLGWGSPARAPVNAVQIVPAGSADSNHPLLFAFESSGNFEGSEDTSVHVVFTKPVSVSSALSENSLWSIRPAGTQGPGVPIPTNQRELLNGGLEVRLRIPASFFPLVKNQTYALDVSGVRGVDESVVSARPIDLIHEIDQLAGLSPIVHISRAGPSSVQVDFTGKLQSSPTVAGPWTDVQGASGSGTRTNSVLVTFGAATRFFRSSGVSGSVRGLQDVRPSSLSAGQGLMTGFGSGGRTAVAPDWTAAFANTQWARLRHNPSDGGTPRWYFLDRIDRTKACSPIALNLLTFQGDFAANANVLVNGCLLSVPATDSRANLLVDAGTTTTVEVPIAAWHLLSVYPSP